MKLEFVKSSSNIDILYIYYDISIYLRLSLLFKFLYNYVLKVFIFFLIIKSKFIQTVNLSINTIVFIDRLTVPCT